MKKRFRGLLALTLALCLVLGMTTGIASATLIYDSSPAISDNYWFTNKDGDPLPEGSILEPGMKINIGSKSSGGVVIIDDVQGGYLQSQDGTPYEDVYKAEVDDNGDIDEDGATILGQYGLDNDTYTLKTFDEIAQELKAQSKEFDYKGYVKDRYKLGEMRDVSPVAPEVEKDANGNITARYAYYSYDEKDTSVTFMTLSKVPIKYTIKYVPGEGAKGTPTEVQFTVEDNMLPSIANASDIEGFSKDGYTAEPKWKLADGTEVAAGADIEDIFYSQLINHAVKPNPDDPFNEEIVLTAIWKENSGGAPGETEDDTDKDTKKDKPETSPDSGDDSNMLPWMMLMTVSMITAVGVTLTSYRRKA